MEQRKSWTNSKAYLNAYSQLYGDTLGIPTSKQKSRPISHKNPVKTEFQEGLSLVCYANAKNLPLVHVPNEGKRMAYQGARLRSQGMRAGFPDYTLYIPKNGYGALMIELKRKERSKISDNQRYWLDLLNKNGYRAVVCYGADEAIKAIEDYLG